VISRDWRLGLGSLRPLRSEIRLGEPDGASEKPLVEPERNRSKHDHERESGSNFDGNAVDGDELHDCLHGELPEHLRLTLRACL